MDSFFKYQGTGNDFVMIDNRDKTFVKSQIEIEQICSRRFGVGADGLILIENLPKYDFKMKYYNADGLEGSMCGNGGRCAVQFASDLGIFDDHTLFMAVDGEHHATIKNNEVSLGMKNVTEIKKIDDYYFLNTGSPHVVIFVDNLKNFDVVKKGSSIRYSDFWENKGGTNVNFVQINEDNSIFVRTYERGVEDETYSCGTGVTAAALVSFTSYNINSPIKIVTLGGSLEVEFEPIANSKFEKIFLKGPAQKVFSGTF